jgi:hypothetical protein
MLCPGQSGKRGVLAIVPPWAGDVQFSGRLLPVACLAAFLLCGHVRASAAGKDCPRTSTPLSAGILYEDLGDKAPVPLTQTGPRGYSLAVSSRAFQKSIPMFYVVKPTDTEESYGAILVKIHDVLAGADYSTEVQIANNLNKKPNGELIVKKPSFDEYDKYHSDPLKTNNPFNIYLHVNFQKGDQTLLDRTDSGEIRRKIFIFSTPIPATQPSDLYQALVIRFTAVDPEGTCLPFTLNFDQSVQSSNIEVYEIYDRDVQPSLGSRLDIRFPE